MQTTAKIGSAAQPRTGGRSERDAEQNFLPRESAQHKAAANSDLTGKIPGPVPVAPVEHAVSKREPLEKPDDRKPGIQTVMPAGIADSGSNAKPAPIQTASDEQRAVLESPAAAVGEAPVESKPGSNSGAAAAPKQVAPTHARILSPRVAVDSRSRRPPAPDATAVKLREARSRRQDLRRRPLAATSPVVIT